MRKRKLIILFAMTIFASALITGCKEEQTAPADPNYAVAVEQSLPDSPKATLSSITSQKQKTWGPIFGDWYGKQAPDFKITDIKGKKHTLSEYKGKNVLLVFWATWCPPCIMEIPHLIELRKTIGEDKLAILAISYIDFRNTTEKVQQFAAAHPEIKYTITSTDITTMPEPYDDIRGIPCSIFIDQQGKIKLASEGLIPFKDTKAIIEAEE